MKASTLASSALLAGAASAQVNFTNAGIGAAPEGLSDPSSIANKQISYPFGNSQWTLTADIQTFAAPDSNVPNAEILNTEYSLGWASGGSLDDAVAAAQGLTTNNFCITVLESLLPWNSLKHYEADKEDEATESCKWPLREACYEKMIELFTESEPDENGCRGTDIDLSNVYQCEWTFQAQYRRNTFNLLANETLANQTSGSGFAHLSTGIYDGSNSTWRDQAEGRLQMVILDSGELLQPLCMRVDADAITAQGASNDATTGAASLFVAGAAAIVGLAWML